MISNAANTDILQLANRISSVTEVSKILSKHPQWDDGPWQLKLPTFNKNEETIVKTDHINLTLWTGDNRVSQVLPVTCWNEGRHSIENDYKNARVLFNKMEDDGVDVLFPFAVRLKDQLDGVVVESDDRELEVLETMRGSPSADTASPEDLDLKDQVAIKESGSRLTSFEPFIEVQGKPVYKARIL